MIGPHLLGRHVRHDPRSRAFAAVTVPTPTRSVWWHHYGAVLDQGNIGACTAFALAQWRNTAPVHAKGDRLLRSGDAFALYHEETLIDDRPGSYPPDDPGGTGVDVCRAARNMGTISSFTHAFGLAHAVGAIPVGPFIVGTNWYEAMFRPTYKGLVTIGGEVAGGHEYLCTGRSVHSGLWRFLQSWGPGWGVHGKFYMTSATFDRLLDEQGDVTVPVL